jgi:Tol biopolymer transport system component
LAPDDRRVAVHRTVQGNADIWLLDGTRTTRLTFDASVDQSPVWSPDGRVVFRSSRRGHNDLYVTSPNRPGAEELLLESAQDKNSQDWSRDGQFLIYQSIDSQTLRDLWVLPLAHGRPPYVWLQTRFDERQAKLSPDARWMAYTSNESGQYEIHVRPFSETGSANTTEGRWQVSTAGGTYPNWRTDGTELYYIAPDGKLMAASVSAKGTTFESGTPVALFQTQIVGGGTSLDARQYDVSDDGRFLINTVLDDVNAPITLIQNWQPGRAARESR